MLLFIVLAVVLITQVVGNLGRSGDVSYSDMRALFHGGEGQVLHRHRHAPGGEAAGRLQRQLRPPQLRHVLYDMNDLVVSPGGKGRHHQL